MKILFSPRLWAWFRKRVPCFFGALLVCAVTMRRAVPQGRLHAEAPASRRPSKDRLEAACLEKKSRRPAQVGGERSLRQRVHSYLRLRPTWPKRSAKAGLAMPPKKPRTHLNPFSERRDLRPAPGWLSPMGPDFCHQHNKCIASRRIAFARRSFHEKPTRGNLAQDPRASFPRKPTWLQLIADVT